MVSIQTIMLVALGFLSATLLALLIAPAFWRRAVRLTTRRLKEQLPLTDAEIKADKDRLRAEYAIRVHKLEMKVEQAALQRARQLIEINRRDGNISQLEQERVQLLSKVDENQNARRVLEQTVADRLPKVESRLNEAKQLLFSRDREIADLTQSTSRQQMALEEAHSINAQQTSEIDRLTTALTVRGARNQNTLADPSFEGELALRSEIEALRAKTREQAGMIGRLQAHAGRGALLALGEAGPAPEPLRHVNGAAVNGALNGSVANGHAHDGPALALVTLDDARVAADREIRNFKARVNDQGAEIVKLTAELATFKSGEEATGLRDSKIALKARLNAAHAQVEHNGDTIKRLRAELAAANERLALQGAHFMEQMRRLGAGTMPAAGQTRRPVTQGPKLTLSERVARSRPPLTPVPKSAKPASTEALARSDVVASAKALPASGAAPATVVSASQPAAETSCAVVIPLTVQDRPAEAAPAAVAGGDSSATAPEGEAVQQPVNPARKPRLIDRISNISKA